MKRENEERDEEEDMKREENDERDEEEDGDSSGGEFLSDMVTHFKTFGSKRVSKRLSLIKRDSPRTTKMKRRKTKVQNELLESERSYVSDLQQLLNYIHSLQDFGQSWSKIGTTTRTEIAVHVREIAKLRPRDRSAFGTTQITSIVS